MAVQVIKNAFSNQTAGAPDLTGQDGSLIAVLDFALVSTLGWSKAFSGTNKAVYRPASGSRLYFRVDNTDIGLDSRHRCNIEAYESMTDVDTGTGRFPTELQVQAIHGSYSSLQFLSSSTKDATAREWIIVGDEATAYFFVDWDSNISHNGIYNTGIFGDFTSTKPTTDDWSCLIVPPNDIGNQNQIFPTFNSTPNANGTYSFVPRTYTGLGTSEKVGLHTDYALTLGAAHAGSSGLTFPHPVDGGVYMAPMYVHEGNSTAIRGRLRGIWNPCHNRPFNSEDTFAGTGTMAGKTFEAIATRQGQVFIETSNTWTA